MGRFPTQRLDEKVAEIDTMLHEQYENYRETLRWVNGILKMDGIGLNARILAIEGQSVLEAQYKRTQEIQTEWDGIKKWLSLEWGRLNDEAFLYAEVKKRVRGEPTIEALKKAAVEFVKEYERDLVNDTNGLVARADRLHASLEDVDRKQVEALERLKNVRRKLDEGDWT